MLKRVVWCAVVLGILAGIQLVLPHVLTNLYYQRILMLCGISVILAVSLNLVNGLTGQFSIGHAGFMAVGGYTAAVLSMRVLPPLLAALLGLGLPRPVAEGAVLLVALLGGGTLAAIAGWAVGLPSLRLRGDYLAIVTLGFGEIIRVVILNIDAIGGARGLSGVPQYTTFFWVGLWATIVIVLSYNLLRSTHGRAMLAVREDEIAAEALGVDTTRYKVTAFVLSAFFAGVAGGLFAHFDSYLNPSSFTFLRSIEIVTMVVLGGMGSVSGSVLAAIFLTGLPELLRPVKEYRLVLYAFLLIVLMITRPQGLMGTRELRWPWGRKRERSGTLYRRGAMRLDPSVSRGSRMRTSQTRTDGQASALFSPAGGAIAAICFFLPWIKLSCLPQAVSGADLGGVFWLVFISALAILGAALYYRSLGRAAEAKPIVIVSALVGLGVLTYRLLQLFGGVETGAGRISGSDLGLQLQVGAYGTIGGFLIALFGTAGLGNDSDIEDLEPESTRRPPRPISGTPARTIAVKYCQHCGESVKQGDRFCGKCGTALPEPE